MPRTILVRQILGEDIIGTHHIPGEQECGGGVSMRRTGVLLLNSGPAPRSGNSDLSARLGDHLAAMGVATFRFDFPGLGDSSGDTPRKANEFWRETQCGRNNKVTLALIDMLRNDFDLSALVVGGLCAAVVPTVYSAATDSKGLAGMILLEPSFQRAPLHDYLASDANEAVEPDVSRANWHRILSLGAWIRYMTSENWVGRTLGPMRPGLLAVQRRFLGHTLIINANTPLISSFFSALKHGVPTLVVIAEGPSDVSRIVMCLPGNLHSRSRLVRIAGTNHLLTAGDAGNVVLDEVARWIKNVIMT